VLTVVALVIAVVAIGSPRQTQTSRERTVTATEGVVQTTVSGSGSLQPSKQLDLSFGASGAVTHVYVKPGDQVVKGQLLAKIDPSSAEADLAQAKADLQSAEDTLTKAQSSNATASATTSAVYSYISAPNTTTTTTPTTTAPTTTTPTTTTPATKPKTQTKTTTTPAQAPQQTAAPQSSGGSGSSSGGGSSSASGGSSGSTVSVAAASAAVTSAKLAVTKAEKALAATKLIAPDSGTVAAVNGAVGDNVTAGSSGSSTSSGSSGGSSSASSPSVAGGLGSGSSSSSSSSSGQSSSSGFITLVKVHRFTMDVSLSESDIGSVKIGQAATVTVNAASGEQFAAHVTAIGVLPSSSGSTSAVSYPVTLLLDQSSRSLKAGMSATADIVTAQTNGITIPTQALTGSTVTVVQNGKQSERTVTTGLTGDSTTQIVSGLNAGDQVIVRSVTVTPSTTAAGAQQARGLGGAGGAGGLARSGGGFGGGGFGGGGFGGGVRPGAPAG
jgi:multidrug efflux pump subunit AcrA (membrane-fusion protein)